MDKGTRIRTVLAVLVSINTALATLDVAQFGNEKATLIYKIVSVAVAALTLAVNTYYNQQYTEEACKGTGLTRELKKLKDNPDGEEEFEEFEDIDDDEVTEND